MSKKVIEQNQGNDDVCIKYNSIEVKVLQFNGEHQDVIYISKSKAREVALAISPELESELKEAVELIKELHMTSGYNNKWHEKSELGIKSKAFLTKQKSKE